MHAPAINHQREPAGGPTDRQTDGRRDRRTDGRTDWRIDGALIESIFQSFSFVVDVTLSQSSSPGTWHESCLFCWLFYRLCTEKVQRACKM